MPIPTPFHERTSARCVSLSWKDWAGYYAVRSYDTYPEREYFAIRHAAAVIDVTPLFKYDVTGPAAAAFLSRIMVRHIGRIEVGQVAYTCWCDDDGKLVDDGTVSRLDDAHFRVTSAEPAFAWLQRFARGVDVRIQDSSLRLGALSVQGPNSRSVLEVATGSSLAKLRYFRLTRAKIDGADVVVSRTGYTGDLGYEVWVERDDAIKVWDALFGAGRNFGLEPAGLDAMDVTRIEAGYILNGVDYYGSIHCLIDARKSSPYEMGLGWMVRLKRAHFNGQAALRAEKETGSPRSLVGLVVDWDEYAALFETLGLPPEVPTAAWRAPVPIYDDTGVQVGYATSGAWSPILKKNLALATVHAGCERPGTKLLFEVTAEYVRHAIAATVVDRPFFDPDRKRA